MTKEIYDKANQINTDRKALDSIGVPCGMSDELKEGFKAWVKSQKERLDKEFEEL